MCSIKSKSRKSRYYAKRNWKHSDLLKINELENQEQEYIAEGQKNLIDNI